MSCCSETMGRWKGSEFPFVAADVLRLYQDVFGPPNLIPHEAGTFFGELIERAGLERAVEVGVNRGKFGAKLLEAAPNLREYYAVDPWLTQANSEDHWNLPFGRQNENLRDAVEALNKAGGDRVRILQLTSFNASRIFDEESLDFVFLDARHDYCSVLGDLRTWWPKVRKGGFIAGDDFHRAVGSGTAVSWQLCPTGRRHPGGVEQAVDDFFDKQFGKGGRRHVLMFPPKLRAHIHGNPHWLVQKPVRPGSR